MSREYSYGRLVTGHFAHGVLDYVQHIGDNSYFKYKKATAVFTNIEGVRHLGKYVGEISFGSAEDNAVFIKIHASEDLLRFVASFNNLPSYKDDLGLRIGLKMNLQLSPRSALGIRDLLSEWGNRVLHPDNGNNQVIESHLIKSLAGLEIESHKNDSLEQISQHLQSPECIVESELESMKELLAEQIKEIDWANG